VKAASNSDDLSRVGARRGDFGARAEGEPSRAWLFNPDWWGILIVVTAGKPWWLMTESGRKGYRASVYWAALGLYYLVTGLTFNVWPLLLGAASSLVLASLFLASAIALRRRERSRPQARSRVGEGPSPQRGDHGERS